MTTLSSVRVSVHIILGSEFDIDSQGLGLALLAPLLVKIHLLAFNFLCVGRYFDFNNCEDQKPPTLETVPGQQQPYQPFRSAVPRQ